MFAESSDYQARGSSPSRNAVRCASRGSCINFLVTKDRPHFAGEVLAKFGWKQPQERVEKSLR